MARFTVTRWAAALAFCLLGTTVRAEDPAFPTRIVKLVVGQAPGGTTDILARAVAARLGDAWKHNVIVENITGASGNIGAQQVARATPDGYTLLMTYEGSQAINPWVLPPAGFDAVKDFTPILTIARAGFLIVTGPNSQMKSIADLVAAAKAKPDTVTYGSSGAGSANHLIAALLEDRSGIRLRHVPYRGASQSVTDVMAGQIDFAVASIPSSIGNVSAGNLKALAVTSAERSAALPQVPTVAESGVPGYDVTPWWGILAPPGMDPALQAKISGDLRKILEDPAVKETFAKQGAEVFVRSPQDFQALLAKDVEKWGELTRKIKVN